MFLHPRQVADLMSRFPEVTAYQMVITREEHRDDLALRVVVEEGIDTEDLSAGLKTAAREGLKFRLEVAVVPSLPPDADPILDERTWE
jgi:phenylacetate-CoA ligase